MIGAILAGGIIIGITLGISFTFMEQAMASPTDFDCRLNLKTDSIKCPELPGQGNHVEVLASWDDGVGKPFACHVTLSNVNPTGTRTGTLTLLVDDELDGCSISNILVDYRVTGRL